MPEKISKRFPKSKIISLTGDDYSIATRYIETTALFLGHLKMKWMGENTLG